MRIMDYVALGALLSIGLLTGCDDETDVDGAEFRIAPSEITLAEVSGTAALRVIGGIEPFTWTVSDESLGSVSGTGINVTYTRTGQSGVNTVTVTDDSAWTASALIVQPNSLTITPATATLAANGDKAVFQAGGGRPPYDWSTTEASRGTVTPQGINYAVYTRMGDGANQVLVTDSLGLVAVAAITQPPAAGS